VFFFLYYFGFLGFEVWSFPTFYTFFFYLINHIWPITKSLPSVYPLFVIAYDTTTTFIHHI